MDNGVNGRRCRKHTQHKRKTFGGKTLQYNKKSTANRYVGNPSDRTAGLTASRNTISSPRLCFRAVAVWVLVTGEMDFLVVVCWLVGECMTQQYEGLLLL